MILLPRAAEELKIPFVASGGMADARSLVAALAMGAAGMNMGTRFIATKEAPVHDNVKKALVAASELDTRLIMRALRNTERVLKNAAVDKLLEIEREKGAKLKIDDIHEEVAGVYPKVMIDGDMDDVSGRCHLSDRARGPFRIRRSSGWSRDSLLVRRSAHVRIVAPRRFVPSKRVPKRRGCRVCDLSGKTGLWT